MSYPEVCKYSSESKVYFKQHNPQKYKKCALNPSKDPTLTSYLNSHFFVYTSATKWTQYSIQKQQKVVHNV